MEEYALVFDWDQTLSPIYMEEPLVEKLGVAPAEYWKDVREYDKRYPHGESFMRVLLEEPKYSGLRRGTFEEAAKDIPYYEGVQQYFEGLRSYAKERGIDLKIYVVSVGLKELVQNTPVAKYLDGVYAGEFRFEGDRPVGIVDTLPPEEKPAAILDISRKEGIPLDRFIYFGDGASDLAAFDLLKQYGGTSVCVGEKEEHQRRATYARKPDYRELEGFTKELIERDRAAREAAGPERAEGEAEQAA